MGSRAFKRFPLFFLIISTQTFSVPLTPLDLADVRSFSFVEKPEPPKKPNCMHQAPYKGVIDINYSPYAGGEDLLSATRVVEWTERFLLNTNPLCNSKSLYARLWRVSEMTLGWLPVNYFGVVVQHEVFGHGYRIRDINHGAVSVEGYQFEMPPPFGSGGGATFFEIGENFTTTQFNTITSGGVESTAILAQLTKLKWLEAGFIDPRQSVLYLLSQQDITLYIGTLKALDESDLNGHDINNYIQSLNQTYTAKILTKGRLLNLSWINLADPFTYYSIWSWLHYISSGKESTIPMIPIFGARYLPGLRLGLTPFGPEIFLDNYLMKGGKPYYFYLKGGNHSDNTYVGIGCYAPKIYELKKWAFGLRFDAWRQPKLLLTPGRIPISKVDFDQNPDPNNPLYPYSEQYQTNWGCAGSGIVYFRGSPRYGVELELGYKSIGFLPGYALKTSPVARFSMVLVF